MTDVNLGTQPPTEAQIQGWAEEYHNPNGLWSLWLADEGRPAPTWDDAWTRARERARLWTEAWQEAQEWVRAVKQRRLAGSV